MVGEECPWCKRNPACPGDAGDGCSLRLLPMEKEAIIGRIVQERKLLLEALKVFAKGSESAVVLHDAKDRMAGVQIMAKCLEEDFGVGTKELAKIVGGSENVSFADKLRLMVRLAELKKARKGKG